MPENGMQTPYLEYIFIYGKGIFAWHLLHMVARMWPLQIKGQKPISDDVVFPFIQLMPDHFHSHAYNA